MNHQLIDGNHYDIVLCEPWFLLDPPNRVYELWKDDPEENVSMDFLEVGLCGRCMIHITNQLRMTPESYYTSSCTSTWSPKTALTVSFTR
jgi:hypothetical protein